MIDELTQHGIVLDADEVLRPALDRRSPRRRPAVDRARRWSRRGMSTTTNEAFDRWLSRGRPAFVSRAGPAPAAAAACVHDAGGVVSVAHPGLLDRDRG